MARAGARFQAQLDERVFKAVLARAVSPSERARPATGVRDLETIQRFTSSSGPFAFFDAPWTPIFLCVFIHVSLVVGSIGPYSLVVFFWL